MRTRILIPLLPCLAFTATGPSDSTIDRGQGCIALSHYRAGHPNEAIHLTNFGSEYPTAYHIHARPLGEDQRIAETAVVSSTQLLRRSDRYRWLLNYPLRAMAGPYALHIGQRRAAAG